MGKQDMKTQLLTKSPKDLLFQLAIPGIIGMVVIGLYPFMDGIFAGWIIGKGLRDLKNYLNPINILRNLIELYLKV